MAKRAAGREIILDHGPLPPATPDRGDDAREYFEPDADVTRLLVDLGKDSTESKVIVFKVPTDRGKATREQWLFECPPADFSPAILQSEYGEGTYRIRMYGEHPESGEYGLLLNRFYDVGPARRSMVPVNGGAHAALAGGTVVNVPDVTKGVIDAIAPMLAAVMGNKNAVPTRAEMLQEMKLYAEIFKPAPVADPMAQFAQFMTLAKTMGLGGAEVADPEAAPWQVLMEGLRTFKEMAARGAPAAAAPALPAPGAPGAADPGALAPAAPVNPEDANEMNIMLKGQLIALRVAAQANDDPEKWAGRIYEDAPDEIIAVLMDNEKWFAELLKLEPGFASLKPWAEKVRGIVVKAIQDDIAEQEAAAGGTALNVSAEAVKTPADGGTPAR